MNITIVEDSQTIAHIIASTTEAYGFIPRIFKSSELKGAHELPDTRCVIANSHLKHIEASKIVEEIKSRKNSPGIIFVNNKGTWKDSVELIDLGADDVLSYPFPMQELIARIKSTVNRPRPKVTKVYEFGMLSIDLDRRQTYLADNQIDLRKKEFNLLKYLAENKDRAISRSELLDHVWDYRRINNSNTVDVHINKLRRKLNNKEFIKTVHGYGYQFQGVSKEEIEQKNNSNKSNEVIKELD